MKCYMIPFVMLLGRDGSGQITQVTNRIFVGLNQVSPLQIRAKGIEHRWSQVKFPNRNMGTSKMKTMKKSESIKSI